MCAGSGLSEQDIFKEVTVEVTYEWLAVSFNHLSEAQGPEVEVFLADSVSGVHSVDELDYGLRAGGARDEKPHVVRRSTHHYVMDGGAPLHKELLPGSKHLGDTVISVDLDQVSIADDSQHVCVLV